MKVFISWSGTKSQQVAAALHDWLPGVMNNVEPFMSAEDIYAGARWQSDIATTLDASNFGIVCVTRENQASPWLNFEAGALAKAVDISRVIPLAVDLKPSDVQQPLGQFQAQQATENGLRAVVVSINDALADQRLADDRLRKSFDVWWPDLKAQLDQIEQETVTDASSVRSDRELLEETLDTVRAMARFVDQVGLSAPLAPDWIVDHLRGTSPAGGFSRAMLMRDMNELPENERRVLELRYGLAGEREHTLREIGGMLGVTGERVSRLERRALRRLGLLPPGDIGE